jgi:type IV pilus assembly protein PilV
MARRTAVNPQQGFTLLEILVAIVVLSIGLLGLAALQAVSLNNNQIAYYRSIASQQAYDMADRIRANSVGVAAGNYNALTATIPADPDCMTNVCSAANMAIADHAQWNTNNQRLLPAGVGTVTGAAGIFTITVSWSEKTAVGNVTQSFVTTMTP